MEGQYNLFDVDKIIEIEHNLHSFIEKISTLQTGDTAHFKNCSVARNRFYEVEIGHLYHEMFHTAQDVLHFFKKIDLL